MHTELSGFHKFNYFSYFMTKKYSLLFIVLLCIDERGSYKYVKLLNLCTKDKMFVYKRGQVHIGYILHLFLLLPA
jgi:hypothetical protein